MPLLELPYDLPGRVFRSQMPFSSYDPFGMFVACMAAHNLGYSSNEAILWVRECIPGAIEVPEQIRIIELNARGGS